MENERPTIWNLDVNITTSPSDHGLAIELVADALVFFECYLATDEALIQHEEEIPLIADHLQWLDAETAPWIT
jgi:hypothetical protein